MAYSFNGTDQVINSDNPAFSLNQPITMSCVCLADSSESVRILFSAISQTSNTSGRIYFVAASNPSLKMKFETGDGSTAETVSTTDRPINAYFHVAGRAFSGQRDIMLEGESPVLNNTSKNIATLTRLQIGGWAGLESSRWIGLIAECALWTASLTDAEVRSLAKGFKAHRVRPQSLLFYAPLVRAVRDLRGGITLTPAGSPTVAVHPRVY